MKHKWIVLLVIGSLLTGAGGTYTILEWKDKKEESSQISKVESKSNQEYDGDDNLDKVERAYNLILNNYVQEVGEKTLIEGAIQGMLNQLKDPYSVYMDKETSRQFSDTLESTFEGIGAEISKVDGKIMIVSPFKDSPADKAGIKPNDQILKINGESVEGLELFEATQKIKGKKGTKVKLEIARKGLNEPVKLEIIRDEIPQITVHSDMKEQDGKKIGYMELTTFSESTAEEFFKELQALEQKGMEGLLIDVRGNPGGLLSSVEEILKEFVSKEHPYVQIEKRDGKKKRYFSSLNSDKDYPVAVLVDKESASAAEILAGALQEAEDYKLIGETTFGKGTVQQAVPMGDGSNIKLTIYKWLTPNGNWIHNKGIKPDIEVEQPDIYHTHPINAEKPLEKDMNNEQVKNAQQILDGLGLAPGRMDGYFSEQTEIAVKAFQQKHKLPLTGKIDVTTASALELAAIEAMKKESNDLQLQTALRYLTRE
ncbi:S41 family peptidase [Bacillus massilinigeriensis]|uniref:S41 family peptidase n=1 Tax=Bacillus massilionigeriensis TaxID=1805475 RepID=UPI00096B0D16|nr:S41 family peptidase [Bacillus massilionigeriensis]